MVVLYHLNAYIEKICGAEVPAFRAGNHGVDIFFVLSGMVIAMSLKPGLTAGEFMTSRLLRIWPLYALVTLVQAVILWGSHTTQAGPIVRDAALSLAFIPYWSTEFPGHAWPLLVPGWTLNYEMFFYVALGIALCFRSKLTAVLCALIVIAITTLCALARQYGSNAAIAHAYSNWLGIEFIFGLGIFWLTSQGRSVPTYVAPISAAIMSGLLLMHISGPQPIVVGIPAAILIFSLVSIERAYSVPRALLAIGDASYSIYLTHSLCLRVVYRLMSSMTHGIIGAATIGVICTTASITVGLVVYRFFEKPMHRNAKAFIDSHWPKNRNPSIVGGNARVARYHFNEKEKSGSL